ncbi:MAG TPA: thermonuclease family protein [Roseiarcus sp.]|nr:thermonuclease family protein [Roseiarcus sp.]
MKNLAAHPGAAIVLLLYAALLRGAYAGPACVGGPETRVKVAAIDERLDVALADGREARLSGLDLPDPGRGDPATAAAARSFLSSWLVDREVGLRALSPKPDRWDRAVVELYAAPPAEDAVSPSQTHAPAGSGAAAPEISVSLRLLAAGFARVRPEVETRSCLDERRATEREAREKRLGLWRDPYYGVVEAADLDKLLERDGQFTLVEGTPWRVGEGRSRYFVDFALHRGFTFVIPKKRAKDFEKAGLTISGLTGAKILVRGALDDRFGPRMEAWEPDAIERLDVDDKARRTGGTP